MNKARDRLLMSVIGMMIGNSVNAYEGFDYSSPNVKDMEPKNNSVDAIEDPVFVEDDVDSDEVKYEFDVFVRSGVLLSDAQVRGYGLNGSSTQYDAKNSIVYGDPRVTSSSEPTYSASSLFSLTPHNEVGLKLAGSNHFGIAFSYLNMGYVSFVVTNSFAADPTECLRESVTYDTDKFTGINSGLLEVATCSRRTGLLEEDRIPRKDEVVYHDHMLHARFHGIELDGLYQYDRYLLSAGIMVGSNFWDISPAPMWPNWNLYNNNLSVYPLSPNGVSSFIPTFGLSLTLDYEFTTVGGYSYYANAFVKYLQPINSKDHYIVSNSVMNVTGRTGAYVSTGSFRDSSDDDAYQESSTGKYVASGILSNISYDKYLLFGVGFTIDLAVDT